jgi:hypothetical protein
MERRTTVRLDADLLAAAKRLGVDTGRTLTVVIADALREAVARPRGRRRGMRALPVSRRRGGTWPGVNLDSYAELLDRMESPDADAGR